MPSESQELPRFDIGLVLAGAISGGAYTAGVLDFLIEALDAWEDAKAAKAADAPSHRVVLTTVSGASAGSVVGAILAACLKYDFTHVNLHNSAGANAGNPLFDSWVNMIDFKDLLENRDLRSDRPAISLLDSTKLMEIAAKAIRFGDGVPPRNRPYVSDPTRFIFTLTNLRGVPYQYSLRGNTGLGQDMSKHEDCMRFALEGFGTASPNKLRKNEYSLSYPASASAKWSTWEKPFAWAAVASGAFPVGLAPRNLERRTSDYEDERVLVPGGKDEPAYTIPINPCFTPQNPRPDPIYPFVAVDGGVMDNEPVELCRIELAGGDPLVRNQRDGLLADRALIMVDPFTGPEKPGPVSVADTSLLSNILALFGALKNQARFNPEDIALAADDNVFSRFMVAPARGGASPTSSGASIASGSLGGFGGFVARAYREHDFFLGRRNCQQFLARHFTLPEHNGLFDLWSDQQRRDYRVNNKGSIELPIIPLVKAVHPAGNEQSALPWPLDAKDPADLRGDIGARLDGLYSSYVSGFLGAFLKIGWVVYLKPKLLDYAMKKITDGLVSHGLLSPRVAGPVAPNGRDAAGVP